MNVWDRFLDVLTAQPPFPMSLELLKVLVAVAAAVWVALRQLKISKEQLELTKGQAEIAAAKLKLDLMDRRSKVFMPAWKLYTDVAVHGVTSNGMAQVTRITRSLPQARFLFEKEIHQYLVQTLFHWTVMRRAEDAKTSGTTLPADEMKRLVDAQAFLIQQANGGAEEKFGKYLHFEKWH